MTRAVPVETMAKAVSCVNFDTDAWYPTIDEFYSLIGDDVEDNIPFLMWLAQIPHDEVADEVETFEEVQGLLKEAVQAMMADTDEPDN